MLYRIMLFVFCALMVFVSPLMAVANSGKSNSGKPKTIKPKKSRTPKYPDKQSRPRNVVGAIVRDGKILIRIDPSVIVRWDRDRKEPNVDEIRDAFRTAFDAYRVDGKKFELSEIHKDNSDRLYAEYNGNVIWIIEWHSSERCKCCGGLTHDRAAWCNNSEFHSKPIKSRMNKRTTGF